MKYLTLLFILFLAGLSPSATAQKAKVPRTSVPKIARLLGVRVGYNGQDALERTLGEGARFVSGHPNGREIWRVRSPRSVIETDGFNINRESLVLEELSWTLAGAEKSFPVAKRLPRRSGWMGTISLGATKQDVERLTYNILPPPKKKGDKWTWQAKGFVKPALAQAQDAYRLWTAALTFRENHLVSIDLNCLD